MKAILFFRCSPPPPNLSCLRYELIGKSKTTMNNVWGNTSQL